MTRREFGSAAAGAVALISGCTNRSERKDVMEKPRLIDPAAAAQVLRNLADRIEKEKPHITTVEHRVFTDDEWLTVKWEK